MAALFSKTLHSTVLGSTADAVLPRVGQFLEAAGAESDAVEILLARCCALHQHVTPRRKELLLAVLTEVLGDDLAAPTSLAASVEVMTALALDASLTFSTATELYVSKWSPSDIATARRMLMPTPAEAAAFGVVLRTAGGEDQTTTTPTPPPPAKKVRPERVSTSGAAAELAHTTIAPAFPPAAFTGKAPPSGSAPPPPAPMDPEHPQRVVGATTDKVVQRMQRASAAAGFVADLKYDGERLLARRLHDGTFIFHSRNMLPVPDKKVAGIPALLSAALPLATSFAVDAEILSLHTHGSLNELSKADIVSNGPRVYIFDCVWLNGVDLTPMPLAERRRLLLSVLKPSPRCTMCEYITFAGGSASLWGAHVAVLRDALKTVLRRGLEGFVVKPLASPYRFGGTNWVKVKAGYLDDVDGGKMPPGLRLDLGPPGTAPPPKTTVAAARATTYAAAHAAHASAESTPTPPPRAGPLHSVRLVDTLDLLVVGLGVGDRPTALLACLHAATGQYITIGFAKAPPELIMPRDAMRPYRKTRGLGFCKISTAQASKGVSQVIETLERCPVVEVMASRLNQTDLDSCGGVELSSDAAIVRLRDDKRSKHVSTAQYVATIVQHELKRGADVRPVVTAGGPPPSVAARLTAPGHLTLAPPAVGSVTAPPAPAAPPAAAATATAAGPSGGDASSVLKHASRLLLPAAVLKVRAAAPSVTTPFAGRGLVNVLPKPPGGAATAVQTGSVEDVLVVLVALGKPWVARGAMRDAAARFGNDLRDASNSAFAAKDSRDGVASAVYAASGVTTAERLLLAAGVYAVGSNRVASLGDHATLAAMTTLALLSEAVTASTAASTSPVLLRFHCDVPSAADAETLRRVGVAAGVPDLRLYIDAS